MNIRVKSLSHYGFVSGRREVSGGQINGGANSLQSVRGAGER